MTDLLDDLRAVDQDSDTMLVRDANTAVLVAGYLLGRTEAANLRDYLTEWLNATDPCEAPTEQPTCCGGEDGPCCPEDPGEACVIGCTAVGDHRATGCVVRTALEDAQAAVYGDRQEDYGHPRRNFTRTAILWHGVLMDKLADGESITPQDVALCMVQVKVAREAHEPKRDNRVDGAGYFETLDRLETGK